MLRFARRSKEQKAAKTKEQIEITAGIPSIVAPHTPPTLPEDRTWTLEDFTIGRVLGTGSFGRVVLATHKATSSTCAIKMLSKAHIVKHQQVAHVKAEKETLMHLEHHCIIKLYGTFQDEECVYLVMEYVAGGEFFTHLKQRKKLSEEAAKFYAAQVLLAFEYLHSQNVIYRDLKPENLLLTPEGNLKVTDFGFAKFLGPTKRTYTLCGTPDYLAPEIILNKMQLDEMQGHGRAVDWWAFGVLIYEMLAGYPPFYEEDTAQTYQRILHGRFTFPFEFPVTVRDLVRKLLQVELSKRYGCLVSGVNDIKSHPWLRSIDWSALRSGKLEAPIRPVVKSTDDTSNFEEYKLGPMTHLFNLSEAEQAMFEGI